MEAPESLAEYQWVQTDEKTTKDLKKSTQKEQGNDGHHSHSACFFKTRWENLITHGIENSDGSCLSCGNWLALDEPLPWICLTGLKRKSQKSQFPLLSLICGNKAKNKTKFELIRNGRKVAGGWGRDGKRLLKDSNIPLFTHKVIKVWRPNVKHGNYRWFYHIIWLKFAKRGELQCSHQEKGGGLNRWSMLIKLMESFHSICV